MYFCVSLHLSIHSFIPLVAKISKIKQEGSDDQVASYLQFPKPPSLSAKEQVNIRP